MQATDAIHAALRAISVLRIGETLRSEGANKALDILNRMLHGWQLDGIPINHVTMTELTDEIPVEETHDEAVIYNLAPRLALEYGRPTPPEVIALARGSYANLVDFYGNPKRVEQPASSGFTDESTRYY